MTEGFIGTAPSPSNSGAVIASNSVVSRKTRIAGLSILLAIAVLPLLINSTMRFLGVTGQYSLQLQQYRLFYMMLNEFNALALLFYVLHQNGRRVSEIGLTLRPADLAHGIVLIVGTSYLFYFSRHIVVRAYEVILGHPPPAPSTPFAGYVFSFLMVAIAFVNPFFEELIVRAFLISETAALTGSAAFAIAVSVLLQTAYHVYQGIPNALAIGVVFLVFSLYYVPPIVSHYHCSLLV